jgi:hypothetical protein
MGAPGISFVLSSIFRKRITLLKQDHVALLARGLAGQESSTVCLSNHAKVWRRCGFGRERRGKRANTHGLWPSVAERCCERWVESCRRDLLDHVIILNERHLKRLMSSYLRYYHEDRTHLGLAKDTPGGRATEIRSAGVSKIQSYPRLGGLHHRYAVAA